MRDLRPSSGRETARERRSAARVGVACLASLAVHASTLLGLWAAGAFDVGPRAFSIALKPLDAVAWEANRGLSFGSTLRPPEKPRQIVALPPDLELDPAREERAPPGDVRHLAERDQTVDEETISRYADPSARPLRVPQRKARGRQGSGERGPYKIAVPGRTGPEGGGGADADAATPRPPPEELASVLADPPTPTPTAAPGLPPGDSELPSDGEGGQRIDGRPISGMLLQEYPRPEGGPTLDGLGLEEGPETRLHTRRFEPAAYWTSVRARIQDDWHKRALMLLQQYDPLEDTYFYKPRTVRIAVTIDSRGGVTDVRVLESSRLEFYDAIALAAVKGKQPYPPPPPTAVRPDGSARINMAFTWFPSERGRAVR